MSGVLMQLLTTKRVALGCALALVAGCGKFDAGSRAAAEWRRAVAAGEEVLRRVPQRHRARGPALVRQDGARERRGECRGLREGRAQAPRPPDAAAEGAAARRAAALFVRVVARGLARQGGGESRPRADHAAAPQSQGVRERGARPARPRHRRGHDSPAGRGRRRLRQHRERAASVPVVHRAVHDRRAHGCRARRGPARCAARQHDVQREARHAANAPAGPAARHARRDLGRALLPIRWRLRDQHRGHGGPHLGQRHGVREHRARDARQQGDLQDGDRRRQGHEALRSGTGRSVRRDQRGPQEHQFPARPRVRTSSE